MTDEPVMPTAKSTFAKTTVGSLLAPIAQLVSCAHPIFG
jgi:hypothetical protein